MDEAGIMEGLGVNGLVVGAAELRKAHLKEPNRGNWMTFIECISAEGEALDPLVIFRGKSVQQQWFPNESLENFQDWYFTASENGWTSNELAVEWLTKLFIPRTQPEDKNQYRLLVLDGHGSHITDEFMYTCFKNNVYLLFLPAHTSHILQPLDLSIFSPLKTAYRKYAQRLYVKTDASPFGKSGFLSCLRLARIDALTTRNIKSGWRGGGLWPLNPNIPLRNSKLLAHQTKSLPTQSLEAQYILETPKKGANVCKIMKEKKGGLLSPHTRLILRKIGKRIDMQAYVVVQQREEIEKLQVQLEQLQQNKKGRVQPNPNEKVVNIDNIHEAQVQAAKDEEARKKKEKEHAKKHPPQDDMAKNSFESMCKVFQLEERSLREIS